MTLISEANEKAKDNNDTLSSDGEIIKSMQSSLLNTSDTELDIDDVLKMYGGFGRFQMALLFIQCYLVLTIGQHFTLSVFIGTDPPWRCITNISSDFCAANFGKNIASDNKLFSKRCSELHQSEWEFTTKNDYSFVTEFNLVCEKSSFAALTSSAVYMGGIIGSMVGGTAADAYGRKPVILVTLLLTFLTSLACSFITQIWQLTALRGVLGAVNVSCYFTAFVMFSEFVTPAARQMSANIAVMMLTCTQLALALWASFEKQWRKLQFYSSFPCLVVFFVLIILPESSRWLLAAKKFDAAKNVLQKIAKLNGFSPVEINLRHKGNEKSKKYSYFDLVCSWKVLFLTFSVGIQWTTVGLVYYSLALEASSLGGDMYQTFALTACADFPSFLTSAYTCNRFGRKKSNIVSLLIAGVLCGALALIPQELSWKYVINMVIVIIAKYFTNNAFNGIYTWTFEIFPTVLRSQGVAVCVIFQRIGLLAVPFLTTALQGISYVLPFVFMFGLTLASCVIGLTLPETNKTPTRETYEDLFEKKSVVSSVNGGCHNGGKHV